MKFKDERPLATPEAAERKLLEIANAIEADHAGRLSVAIINTQFRDARGSPEEYRAAVTRRSRAWLDRVASVRRLRDRSRRPGRICSRSESPLIRTGDLAGAIAVQLGAIRNRQWHSVAIIATVQGIGPQLNTKFTSINSSLK
jgi:hypothetical protein